MAKRFGTVFSVLCGMVFLSPAFAMLEGTSTPEGSVEDIAGPSATLKRRVSFAENIEWKGYIFTGDLHNPVKVKVLKRPLSPEAQAFEGEKALACFKDIAQNVSIQDLIRLLEALCVRKSGKGFLTKSETGLTRKRVKDKHSLLFQGLAQTAGVDSRDLLDSVSLILSGASLQLLENAVTHLGSSLLKGAPDEPALRSFFEVSVGKWLQEEPALVAPKSPSSGVVHEAMEGLLGVDTDPSVYVKNLEVLLDYFFSAISTDDIKRFMKQKEARDQAVSTSLKEEVESFFLEMCSRAPQLDLTPAITGIILPYIPRAYYSAPCQGAIRLDAHVGADVFHQLFKGQILKIALETRQKMQKALGINDVGWESEPLFAVDLDEARRKAIEAAAFVIRDTTQGPHVQTFVERSFKELTDHLPAPKDPSYLAIIAQRAQPYLRSQEYTLNILRLIRKRLYPFIKKKGHSWTAFIKLVKPGYVVSVKAAKRPSFSLSVAATSRKRLPTIFEETPLMPDIIF